MKTNEQIFEEIKTQGYITEQQISLLKRRGNHQNEDIFDYSLLDAGQFEYGCFITYFDLANEVKEMARGYDFTVSSVEKFKKSGRLCYVWIVDEGDPATTVTRAI